MGQNDWYRVSLDMGNRWQNAKSSSQAAFQNMKWQKIQNLPYELNLDKFAPAKPAPKAIQKPAPKTVQKPAVTKPKALQIDEQLRKEVKSWYPSGFGISLCEPDIKDIKTFTVKREYKGKSYEFDIVDVIYSDGSSATKYVNKDGSLTFIEAKNSDKSCCTEKTITKNSDGIITTEEKSCIAGVSSEEKVTEEDIYGNKRSEKVVYDDNGVCVNKEIIEEDEKGNKKVVQYEGEKLVRFFDNYSDENGNKVNKYGLYGENGKVKSETIRKNGKVSASYEYDQNGNIKEEGIYNDGMKVASYVYDENGNKTVFSELSSNNTFKGLFGGIMGICSDSCGATVGQSGALDSDGEFVPDNNGLVLKTENGNLIRQNNLIETINSLNENTQINYEEAAVSEETFQNGVTLKKYTTQKDGIKISRVDVYGSDGNFSHSYLEQNGEDFSRKIIGNFTENGEFVPMDKDDNGKIEISGESIDINQTLDMFYFASKQNMPKTA